MTISVKLYLEAARQFGWPIEIIDEERNILAFYPPGEDVPIIIRNNVTELASAIAIKLSNYKSATTLLASKVGFHTPETLVIEEGENYEKAESMLKAHKLLVVKPMDGSSGKGVTTKITTVNELKKALQVAKRHNVKSPAVVVQQQINGNDYRLLMLDGQLVAAIQRDPLSVKGDGQHDIQELLEAKLHLIARRPEYRTVQFNLTASTVLKNLSSATGLTPKTILPKGKIAFIQGVANLSQGGDSTNVTDKVHPDFVKMTAKLLQLVGTSMAGIDVIASDISAKPTNDNHAFIEINIAPNFRGHYYPTKGSPVNPAPLILQSIVRHRQQKRLLQNN